MSEPADAHFPNTHWSLVARIKSPDERVAAQALDELCAQYHYPLYCYLRRRGCEHHDAQDVLHDFLAGLLRQRALERLEESRGRLRGYLATSLGRHLQHWREVEARRCRAGSVRRDDALVERTLHCPLDFDTIADRYARDRFRDSDSPDRVFERRWALEILRQVLEKLAARYAERGKAALFTTLRPVLEAGGSLRGHDTAALAAALGTVECGVRNLLHRLLQEYREVLLAEVRLTVESADEVPGELAYLLSLFQQ
jgi:RNA polymerase sigma-70 factor (ECF subfamily)